MHAIIALQLWQGLVGVVVLAVPVTFVIYWVADSIRRIPTVWHEFWDKFKTKKTATA